jgi:hypothetical protein
MKTALVITDGLRQITLTPESDEEKQMLEILHKQEWDIQVRRGQFFICRGDYARHGTWPSESGRYSADESTMLVLRPPQETISEQGAGK